MAIIVREVSDDDLPRALEIERAAYADNSLSPILFPGPFPSNAQAQRVPELIELRKSDPSVRYLQAYDEESGRMVAFAKWHIYESREAASAAQRPSRIFGPGTNREACEDFFGQLSARKKELMGDTPHLYLHMLHADPAFQGRGAGGMLVEWGTKKADDLGLPAYLESSPKGYRVYQRYGFKDLEVIDFDLTKYGGSSVYKEPLMIREPVASKHVSSG